MPQITHYDTLGVPASATAVEVKAAYRSLIRRYHPDIAGPDGSAMTLRLNAALAELGDIERRGAYDRSIELAQRAAPASFPSRQEPTQPSPGRPADYPRRPAPEPEPEPLWSRRGFRVAFISAAASAALFLLASYYFWWSAYVVYPPRGPIASIPLALVAVALVGTLSAQGKIWPWAVLTGSLLLIPLGGSSISPLHDLYISLNPLGFICIAALALCGGGFRFASQVMRAHWRTRPIR